MNNSRGELEGNADYVLDLDAGHVEIGRDLREAISGLEPVDQILDSSATRGPPVVGRTLPFGSTVTS